VFGFIFSIVVALEGDFHARHVTETQPAKLAAMESLWETTENAPIYLLALPDEKNEKNAIQIGAIPGLLSFLGHHDFNAEIKGLKDFPKDERPPVLLSFLSFRIMVALGTLFPLVTLIGIFLRNRLLENPWYLKLMLFAIPLPYIAIEMGWLLAEVGRQPWIVYGLMKTSIAVSPIATLQVALSLAAFIGVYGLLGALGYFLIIKYAKKGPEAVA
jgi:cytochrome d ubiquinol oxidase subunit I